MSEHLSYCRICAAACGIVVEVDGDRVVRVRGDGDHPASQGYTCSKGRGLPDWHHRPDRLDVPRVRGASVAWDEALDDLAALIATSRASYGPDSVALYLATGLAYDAAGQTAAMQWLASAGSRAFYSATTVDNAPVLVATKLVTGSSALNPVWDPDRPGLLLVVGSNPVISHGYGTTLPDPVQHLRRYRRAGGQVWVLDPRETETAANADEHLAVRPGSDIAVLGAVAAAVLADGADQGELAELCDPVEVDALERALAPFTIERAAAVAGVDHEQILRLVDAIRSHPGRLAMFCGTGVTMSRDGVVAEWLRWVLLILTGSLDREGGMRFHDGILGKPYVGTIEARPPRPGPASRPELSRVAGQMPSVALADEIDAGHVRVLVVAGGNPMTAFPEPERLRTALRKLDALVMVDVVESEMTSLATHVLPVTGQLERVDVTLSSHMAVRSAVQSTEPVVPAGGQRKPAWWVFASLAERAGAGFVGDRGPDGLDDRGYLERFFAASPLGAPAILDAGPHGRPVPVDVGWVRRSLPDGRWRIAPPVMLERLAAYEAPVADLVLAPRRDGGWNNSIRYGRTDEERIIRLHPHDAASAGLRDGEPAAVTSAHGELEAVVAIDPTLRPGVVSIGHGRSGHSPGQLTSATANVDLLTAMPHASGVVVRIRPRG
jgi:anaerobic selenocysteine-containing dehydrogenase